jgi:multiple sugar transport system substrate-binding protein/sn-glycerol 3-phosphate transport system substrate-binding protein
VQNLLKKTFRILSLTLLSLALAGCQTAVTTPQATPTVTLVPATPTLPPPTATSLPTATPTATAAPIPAANLEDLNGLELAVLHPWINESEAAFTSLVEDFNTNNQWGIHIFPRTAGSLSALANALAGGDLEENLFIGNGYDLAAAFKSGALVSLTPYMRDAEWGLGEAYPEVSVFTALAPNPADSTDWSYLPIAYQPALIYYNASWGQELGFSKPPRTPTELQAQMLPAAAEKLLDKDDTNNGAGGLWISDSAQAPLAWYQAFGGEITRKDNNDAFLEAISFLKGAYAVDAAWVGLQKNPYDYFARRQALAYEGTLDDLLTQEGFTARAGSGDEFTILPYPSPDGSGSISLETLSVGIRAGSPAEQLGAWLFARWLLSAPAQEALVHVSGYWPAAGDPNAIAPDYARQHPAWASALQVGVRLQLAPERENWAFSRVVLQDALRRAYQLDLEYIPTVLETLDVTLVELAGADSGD